MSSQGKMAQGNSLAVAAANEVDAFQAFKQTYSLRYPPPQKPTVQETARGWQFNLYLCISTAAVLLASLRTAEMFYEAASGSHYILRWAESILAVATVEVSIVGYSASLASEESRMSRGMLKFGIFLLGSISIVAAFGQTIGVIENAPNWLNTGLQYLLSFLLGPGASIAAILAGHVLGLQIGSVSAVNQEAIDEYEREYEEWYAKLRRAWDRSDEKKAARGEAEISKPKSKSKDKNITLLVEQWLEENNLDAERDQDIISPAQVAEDIGASDRKSSVRSALYRLRNGS